MGDIRTELRTSELGSYQKVFPTLNVPTLGNDVDGYIKTLAEAAIEQVRFLNAFAEIPVEVLYENIGQRHKASNLLAVSMMRRIDGGAGDGLDSVRIQGEESGAYENALINLSDTQITAAELTDIWAIQNEWIDAEIARINKLVGTLERAETLDVPVITDETSRGLWNWILKLPALAAKLEPPFAAAIMYLEAADAAITVGSFAYSIYQRFWVEKETLRNLPKALIELCRLTGDLLRKLRQLPASVANFEMRQSMVTDLTERLEQQMQFFTTGQNQFVAPSTNAAAMEQLTNAIQDLSYHDTEMDIGSIRVNTRSRLITTP